MKKIIYSLIHKLGYKIHNKKRERKTRIVSLKQLFCVEYIPEVLLDSYEYIINLKNKFPELTLIAQENGFIVNFDFQNFFIQTQEEFFILNEVYYSLDYEFQLTSDVVLFDIGANIGIASLFFAKKENVKKIFSFEPIGETCFVASKNFEMNPIANDKIVIHNFGLAGNDRADSFLFDSCKKGRTGVRGEQSNVYNLTDSIKKDVILKDASKILLPIIEENNDLKIVVKMDCEGAEYEIFDNLLRNNVIVKIHVFMVEWHDNGAEQINSILVNSNFTVFNNYLTPVSGMIYAVNQIK